MATIVYDKSPTSRHAGAIPLPNVGREAHTYLHYIVARYETLAPVTVFCQGRPFDHAFDFHKTLVYLAQKDKESECQFRWLGHIIDTDDARGRLLFVPWSKNEDSHELDLDGFHQTLFGEPGPSEYTFRPGGQFVVAAETIRKRPLDFYRRAIEISAQFPDAAHCFERCWDRVFCAPGIDEAWLAGRKTAYLKPIRRLATP